jgi:5-methylcytosine-specific restriction endonuclease McrA
MQLNKKLCAGFDGVEHEAYIYKNINGKKYCKSCTFKLQPPKAIKKMSEKGRFKMSIKKELLEEDKKFYTDVWIKRFFMQEHPNVPNTYRRTVKPHCDVCLTQLPDEPNLMYFHHILEKRNYPALRHVYKNIAILCPECHNMYETYPDAVPVLVERKKELLKDELILKIINQTKSF